MAIRNQSLGGATNWVDGEILISTDVNATFNVISTWVNASH